MVAGNLKLPSLNEIAGLAGELISSTRLLEVMVKLPASAEPMLFGGPIRDLLLTPGKRPRDLDVVAFGICADELLQSLQEFTPDRTTFGGLKLAICDFTVDIWTPSIQVAAAGFRPADVSPHDYLNYVTLSLDSVLFDLNRGQILERGFLQSFADRRISAGIQTRWVAPYRHLHLAHLAYVRDLAGFDIDAVLKSRVQSCAPSDFILATTYLRERKQLANASDLLCQLRDAANG